MSDNAPTILLLEAYKLGQVINRSIENKYWSSCS